MPRLRQYEKEQAFGMLQWNGTNPNRKPFQCVKNDNLPTDDSSEGYGQYVRPST